MRYPLPTTKYAGGKMPVDEIRTLQQEAKRLASTLTGFASIKPSSKTFFDDIRKAANRLPDGRDAGATIDRIREQAAEFLAAETVKRAKAFGTLEAAFVRAARDRGLATREFNSAWRVGPLEVQVQREDSRVRCLYNREPVVPWTAVATEGDLMAAYEKGIALLERSAIPEVELVPLVSRAFDDALRTTTETLRTNGLVPVRDLLRSLRLERIRDELSGSNPGKTLQNHDFPLWAQLYNLDRYRDAVPRIDAEPRVAFQTGSQQEQAQGKSITLNGLSAVHDYHTYTYAIRRR